MTLKTKLISCIVAFVMVASLMMVSILASPTITMQMGGNVSFTATDLQVTISDGVLANGTLEDSANKMQGVKIDAYNDGATELATWTNLNLTFNESGEDMTITFTITNNSTVDDIQATVTVNQGTTDNATVSVTTPSSSSVRIPANDGSQQFVVTFHIDNRNNPASIQGFQIDIDLEKYVPPYERVDAEGNPDPNGEYILFGYYPQSAKASSVTIESASSEFNGYYKGSDGEYYAQAEDGNYYKVERLRWRILDDTYGEGTALIVCDVIVDQVAYQSNYIKSGSYYYATDEGGTILIDEDATIGEGVDSNYQVYANNYKHSELREYLTGTFYNTAFNANEKSSIVQTVVDNSLASTSNFGGQYVCENTNDYVFALSYVEAENTDRNFKPTSYAIANGTLIDRGHSRSPSDDYIYGNYAYYVYDGICASTTVYADRSGAVPALQIKL